MQACFENAELLLPPLLPKCLAGAAAAASAFTNQRAPSHSGSKLCCRLRMDVMRVDSADSQHRYAMCTACYGYMGDLMATSERLRWLGPSRYNLAGLISQW